MTRKTGAPNTLVLLLFLVLSAGTVLQFWQTNRDLKEARGDLATLALSQNKTAEQAGALAAQVKSLGEKPVVDPSSIDEPVQGPQGVQGIQGIQGVMGERGPGPTDAQVQDAVDAYCAGGRCDGRNPTQSQVAAAVSTYCDARGECTGPAGSDGAHGADGTNGADGRDGQDAPPPTDAQVQAAVATYCDNHGGCQGPKGDTGAQGDPGQSAYPFRFVFDVPTNTINPNDPQAYRYTVSCTEAGCDVTREEVQ